MDSVQVRILVVGARGQLARALLDCAPFYRGVDVLAAGRPELDITDDRSIARALDAVTPDVVVNAAGYTNVDKAEREVDAAFAVNRDGAGALARGTNALGCPIIHVSSDHVFDGLKLAPYVETDLPRPQGVYGRSKYAGEAAVVAANRRHVILRSAWLFGAHGHTFLKTLVRLTKEESGVRVVADQQGNPTYATHLAQTILAVAAQLTRRDKRDGWGIFHAAGSGDTTWQAFARAVVGTAARLRVRPAPLMPAATGSYPTPARRPPNARLDCTRLARVYGLRLPTWQKGLEQCMARLAVEAAAEAQQPDRVPDLAGVE
jgi:dTDP-4-dehydrorhamnose reductase